MDQRPKYNILKIKYVEENLGTRVMNLGVREDFINVTPKAREVKAKINEWDCIKLESFCKQRKPSTKQKGNHRMRGDTCKYFPKGANIQNI